MKLIYGVMDKKMNLKFFIIAVIMLIPLSTVFT